MRTTPARGPPGLPFRLPAAPPRVLPGVAGADAALGWLVEIPAAMLVVAEIVVLFAGIVARYVFHTPLIWSDELASILFLWLAMLGAVVAFAAASYMRMTALVNRASPAACACPGSGCGGWRRWRFLLMIAMPGYEYAIEERYVTTPALEISNIWRAAALPVGTALMILIALLRLAGRSRWQLTLGAVALVAAIVAATDGAAAGIRRTGQYQPGGVLRGCRRRLCFRWRAHRVLLRPGDLRLSGA